MKRFAIGLALAVGLFGSAACNKPKEEDCRRAIENIRRLAGTDKLLEGDNIDAWVRRCRGASKKETVQCAIAAQTLDQLRACKIPVEVEKDPFGGSGSGTASGSAAASGSGSGSASAAPK